MQHIHILGIGGTFMGSLAQLAKAKGYVVTGCDQHVYPPMSTQLERAGIDLIEGFDTRQLELKPDVFVVGNVVSRGNPLLEAILNRGLAYTSGPQWLAENILAERWVLAVAGTHGKTTTASMLAWILESAGFDPGYLIGGVPNNFTVSASLGSTGFFVVEADEYDSAFFDKRSKFVHYRPRTLVINNLEFDHADIFADLAAIQTQFHHLVRTVPSDGAIICPTDDAAIDAVLAQGCWTPRQYLGRDWTASAVESAGAAFAVCLDGASVGQIEWTLTGNHNVQNALAAVAAARHVGVDPALSCRALSEFKGVKRRMELLGRVGNIAVYDDFAHHPTAIKTTLAGLRAQVGDAPITAIIEPRSNTMKQGVHGEQLKPACGDANRVYWFESEGLGWSPDTLSGAGSTQHTSCRSIADIIKRVCQKVQENEHIVIMSNGSFAGVHQQLLNALRAKYE